MATLLYHWPLNEGTGTTASALVGNDPLSIAVVSGYPQWVDGAVAGSKGLLFSGLLSTWPDRCFLEPEDRTVGCAQDSGWSLTAWVKINASTTKRSRVIVGAQSSNPATNPTSFTYCDTALLYCHTSGSIRFGFTFGKGATRYNRYVDATTSIKDSAWHFVHGTLDETTLVAKVYVDGALEGTYNGLAEDPAFVCDNKLTVGGIGIAVGCGNADYWTPAGSSYGALDGTVDDPRIYCGVIGSGIIAPYAAMSNALMFSCNS